MASRVVATNKNIFKNPILEETTTSERVGFLFMKEEWRFATNTFKQYEVSNLGRVRSVLFLKTKKITKKYILKPFLKNSYLTISLNCYNKPKKIKVHQLVYTTFIDETFVPYLNEYVIDHIDKNKENNNVNNLQLLKRSENVKKSFLSKKTH